jgi:hypothetical protein
MATAGAIAGSATAIATGGGHDTAAASAVGGGSSIAVALGSGDTASALGAQDGSADAGAAGTDQSANAQAVGGGSAALATVDDGVGEVGATSDLGGWADASTSSGEWTVSINGGTLVS